MTDTKTYAGGCHCGKVRYEVKTALDKVISCNCSICSKTGALLAFVGRDSFSLLSGEGDLAEYLFNKKRIHHTFCTTCGIRSFAKGKRPDGADMVAINVRCLDGVDASALTLTHFDGKSL